MRNYDQYYNSVSIKIRKDDSFGKKVISNEDVFIIEDLIAVTIKAGDCHYTIIGDEESGGIVVTPGSKDNFRPKQSESENLEPNPYNRLLISPDSETGIAIHQTGNDKKNNEIMPYSRIETHNQEQSKSIESEKIKEHSWLNPKTKEEKQFDNDEYGEPYMLEVKQADYAYEIELCQDEPTSAKISFKGSDIWHMIEQPYILDCCLCTSGIAKNIKYKFWRIADIYDGLKIIRKNEIQSMAPAFEKKLNERLKYWYSNIGNSKCDLLRTEFKNKKKIY